jgi:hypothetical protein
MKLKDIQNERIQKQGNAHNHDKSFGKQSYTVNFRHAMSMNDWRQFE